MPAGIGTYGNTKGRPPKKKGNLVARAINKIKKKRYNTGDSHQGDDGTTYSSGTV